MVRSAPGNAAQHGIPADRFAREIVRFLKVVGIALAAAECHAVGPRHHGATRLKVRRDAFPLSHLLVRLRLEERLAEQGERHQQDVTGEQVGEESDRQ